MAGQLPMSSGDLVADLSKSDVDGWFQNLVNNLLALNDASPYVLACLGFAVMGWGFVIHARESNHDAFGGHGGPKKGIWMIVCGGGLGAITSIYLLVIGIFKPL